MTIIRADAQELMEKMIQISYGEAKMKKGRDDLYIILTKMESIQEMLGEENETIASIISEKAYK